MSLDYANIYNLPDHECEYVKEHLWDDAVPGVESYAKNLMQDLIGEDTPCVISLQASFGMGKTFFATRFCEYLNKNGLDCVYLSLWENDYLPTPFLPISKVILDFFKGQEPTTSKEIKKLTDKVCQVSKRLLNAPDVKVGTFFKECGVEVSTNLGKLCEAFYDEKDTIKEFKKTFQEKLLTLEHKRLVLIIDELDRCRPDYALKAMEVLKHFFDLPGLLVLLPCNKDALEFAVQSVYGNCKSAESYLQKFINRHKDYKIDSQKAYETLVNQYINERTMQIALKKEILKKRSQFGIVTNIEYDDFKGCTYQKLCDLSFTLRETKDILNELISTVNTLNRPINIKYYIEKYFMKLKKSPSLLEVMEGTNYSVGEIEAAYISNLVENPLIRFESEYKGD